jgi:hypothetical protein
MVIFARKFSADQNYATRKSRLASIPKNRPLRRIKNQAQTSPFPI